MEVSVRELKNRLSEYLRRIQTGKEVIVTSRGRAIARLVAIDASEKDDEAAAIERIRALPWIIPGNGKKPLGAKNPVTIKPGEKTLAEIISEDRG